MECLTLLSQQLGSSADRYGTCIGWLVHTSAGDTEGWCPSPPRAHGLVDFVSPFFQGGSGVQKGRVTYLR